MCGTLTFNVSDELSLGLSLKGADLLPKSTAKAPSAVGLWKCVSTHFVFAITLRVPFSSFAGKIRPSLGYPFASAYLTFKTLVQGIAILSLLVANRIDALG